MTPIPGVTIAVIPARGGSKGIPGKNIAVLGGAPLVSWSIKVARSVRAIDRVIVSTDSNDVARVAEAYGAEVSERPPHLATDTSMVIDTLRDLIECWRTAGESVRTVVLLEPTCPFRSVADVESCLKLLEDEAIDSVATFKRAELNPHRAWRITDNRPSTFLPGVNPWLPRQSLPAAYQLNGGVYAFRADRLRAEDESILFGNTAAVVMPPERSIDIDEPRDLLVANVMLEEGTRSES